MKQMDDKDLRMMGYSIQEIAEILEITPQNAKVRLHRARQMILKEMEAIQVLLLLWRVQQK